MKSMLILSLLTAALLVAPCASHAASVTSEAPALCAANSSVPALPFFAQAPPKLGASASVCGSCSVSVCRGAALYSQCGVTTTGRLLYCDDFGRSACPADGLANCTCTAIIR